MAGARGCLDNWFVVNFVLYFIGCHMKITLYMIVLTVATGWLCFVLGQRSVQPIIPKCQETKLSLIASRINHNEVVCVDVEPWQIKGKTKRIENVIQKKT